MWGKEERSEGRVVREFFFQRVYWLGKHRFRVAQFTRDLSMRNAGVRRIQASGLGVLAPNALACVYTTCLIGIDYCRDLQLAVLTRTPVGQHPVFITTVNNCTAVQPSGVIPRWSTLAEVI